ncbi:MAG: DNA adenine methylase [Oscillospiraceae bacterium]|jgi:DNA adenine methylase|nr:DNA adenine methylase [Oscillospiraceae bacterium]
MKAIAKPFVKWAGGKSQILSEIRAKYPFGVGKAITKYAEPFIGGGAVLFDLLSCYEIQDVYISDINRELIHTYTIIRDSVSELISSLSELESEYLPADDETRKAIYYAKRNRFNELKAGGDVSVELAALFIFLNRTCFNGLYRVNAKGGYNVPQGSYKNPKICDTNNLLAVSAALRGVTIVCGDYKLSREFIDERTFAYFDPPYRPLTATSNFTAYAQDGFGDEQQIELARFIDEMSERGAWIVASNSDPKNANESDNFFDVLYAKHAIMRIDATRAISSVGSSRGCVRELLIARA